MSAKKIKIEKTKAKTNKTQKYSKRAILNS